MMQINWHMSRQSYNINAHMCSRCPRIPGLMNHLLRGLPNPFFIFGCWSRLDLNVDFIVFDATDLAVIEIFHLTSTDDLDESTAQGPPKTQGLCIICSETSITPGFMNQLLRDLPKLRVYESSAQKPPVQHVFFWTVCTGTSWVVVICRSGASRILPSFQDFPSHLSRSPGP